MTSKRRLARALRPDKPAYKLGLILPTSRTDSLALV